MNYIIKGEKIYRKGTLAHYLDKRDLSIGEPTVMDLPATINPFKFIHKNLLKNNCSIIKLKHSEIKYSTDLLGLLNELLPVEQTVFIYIDIDDIRTAIPLKIYSHVTSMPAMTCSSDVPLFIQSSLVATSLKESCE